MVGLVLLVGVVVVIVVAAVAVIVIVLRYSPGGCGEKRVVITISRCGGSDEGGTLLSRICSL